MLFENLNITENFASAVNSLKGLAGIYAIKCVITGAMYVGSSMNLGVRMNRHFINSSNIHLRNAIKHYGFSAFVWLI
jgi:group I intron endonuclease